jgi:hypothetical protein
MSPTAFNLQFLEQRKLKTSLRYNITPIQKFTPVRACALHIILPRACWSIYPIHHQRSTSYTLVNTNHGLFILSTRVASFWLAAVFWSPQNASSDVRRSPRHSPLTQGLSASSSDGWSIDHLFVHSCRLRFIPSMTLSIILLRRWTKKLTTRKNLK